MTALAAPAHPNEAALKRAGIDELEPWHRSNKTPAEIEHILAALALNGGNTTQTEKVLAAQGIKVTDSTLLEWRDERFPNRYRAACIDLAPQIEAAVLDSWRALALKATKTSFKAVELEDERIAAGEVKDAAGSARNLATVAGIAVDKILNLTNRPTQIVEHRTADQALRRLEDLARTVDSTAVEA